MLSYAVTFFVIAIIAAVLGFGGIAGSAASIAQVLFFVFLVLALVSFLTGRGRVIWIDLLITKFTSDNYEPNPIIMNQAQ